jgi:hypothetical protein
MQTLHMAVSFMHRSIVFCSVEDSFLWRFIRMILSENLATMILEAALSDWLLSSARIQMLISGFLKTELFKCLW